MSVDDQAKLRRVAVDREATDGTSTVVADEDGGVSAAVLGARCTDDAGKDHRTTMAKLTHLSRQFYNRRRDTLVGTGLASYTVIGYVYVSSELLLPPRSACTEVLVAFGYVSFFFVVASYIGMILYGKSNKPPQGFDWQAPPELKAALAVGKYARMGFGAESRWCFECNSWKQPLVHHCRTCGKCSLCMDHHCMFSGQCIGITNYRSFIQFLVSAQLLIFVLTLLGLRHVLFTAQGDVWVFCRMAVFFAPVFFFLKLTISHLRYTFAKLSRGWLSEVLFKKFMDVAMYAQDVEHRYSGAAQQGAPALPGLQQLVEANQRVLFPQGGLRGLFAGDGLLSGLSLVFGGRPSWRWLLPLRPGSFTKLLDESTVCTEACEAWATVAKALETHHSVMAHLIQLQRLEQLEQQSRAAEAFAAAV